MNDELREFLREMMKLHKKNRILEFLKIAISILSLFVTIVSTIGILANPSEIFLIRGLAYLFLIIIGLAVLLALFKIEVNHEDPALRGWYDRLSAIYRLRLSFITVDGELRDITRSMLISLLKLNIAYAILEGRDKLAGLLREELKEIEKLSSSTKANKSTLTNDH